MPSQDDINQYIADNISIVGPRYLVFADWLLYVDRFIIEPMPDDQQIFSNQIVFKNNDFPDKNKTIVFVVNLYNGKLSECCPLFDLSINRWMIMDDHLK